MTKQEIDIELEPGLRYTEETGRVVRSLPVRDCFLWKEGIEEPISGMNIVSIRQRFGTVVVPCEGIGGVETLPEFRRQGYMSRLMRRALQGISERVKVAFIADAVEDVYEKFGFVTCLAESQITLRVREVERLDGGIDGGGNCRLRAFAPADLPAMIELYNREHARRSGTHERHEGWNRLIETTTWRPGSEVIICERNGTVVGYAILMEQRFGSPTSAYVVDEITAVDLDAARTLLIELAIRCWQLRLSEFIVHEPLDSTVGRAAQEIGCRFQQAFTASGWMMGAVLNRPGLLRLLEEELLRRLPGGGLQTEHTRVFVKLCEGAVIPNNRSLLRLLMGYWSLMQALDLGVEIAAEYEAVCEAWFPERNTRMLPLPHSHRLDRY